MLISTVPDDRLMYSGFYFIFNITSIVNVFMLSIEKKIDLSLILFKISRGIY